MWYVVQVAGGQEEETAALMRKRIGRPALEECFIPQKERNKKFRGRWRVVREILFPGYVFTATAQPEELFLELKKVTRLTKLLRDDASFFIPLSQEEEALIRSIGDSRHVTRVSRVAVKEMPRGEGMSGQKGAGRTGDMSRSGGADRIGNAGGVGNAGCLNRAGSTGGAETSTAPVCGTRIVVLSGPLKNLEGYVTGCNLHKREVTVRIPFMGQETEVRMGIEIVREKETQAG